MPVSRRNGRLAALDQPGSRSMSFLHELFSRRGWNRLVPDRGHTRVTAGYGSPNSGDYVTAADTPDGRLLLASLPTVRAVIVDMTRFSSPMAARWFDPSAGTFADIAGSPFPNTGSRVVTPSGPNAEGAGDWVLVLEATQPAFPVLRRARALPLDPVRDLHATAVASPVRVTGDGSATDAPIVYHAVPDARTLAAVRDGADVIAHFWF